MWECECYCDCRMCLGGSNTDTCPCIPPLISPHGPSTINCIGECNCGVCPSACVCGKCLFDTFPMPGSIRIIAVDKARRLLDLWKPVGSCWGDNIRAFIAKNSTPFELNPDFPNTPSTSHADSTVTTTATSPPTAPRIDLAPTSPPLAPTKTLRHSPRLSSPQSLRQEFAQCSETITAARVCTMCPPRSRCAGNRHDSKLDIRGQDYIREAYHLEFLRENQHASPSKYKRCPDRTDYSQLVNDGMSFYLRYDAKMFPRHAHRARTGMVKNRPLFCVRRRQGSGHVLPWKLEWQHA
jgi:hypothetical protein